MKKILYYLIFLFLLFACYMLRLPDQEATTDASDTAPQTYPKNNQSIPLPLSSAP